MIDLAPQHLQIINEILQSLVPDCTVWAYGSRVKGTSHVGSDLDIVLIGIHSLPVTIVRKVSTAFRESNLPFMVDVLDWNTIPATFQKTIAIKYEILQNTKSFTPP